VPRLALHCCFPGIEGRFKYLARMSSFSVRALRRFLKLDLGPPKAEVTGSNPVGCANYFNGLWSL
jgi:hypothetical protein